MAMKMAEDKGAELGCEKEKMVGVLKQRTRCMLEVTAIRARARARAQRITEDAFGMVHHGAG